MRWFKNLKISAKLLVGFGIVIVLSVFSSVTSILTIRSINSKYSHLISTMLASVNSSQNTVIQFTNARRSNYGMALNILDNTLVKQYYLESVKYLDESNLEINKVITLLSDKSLDPTFSNNQINLLKNISKQINENYKTTTTNIYNLSLEDKLDLVNEEVKNGANIAKNINDQLNAYMITATDYANKLSSSTLNDAKNNIIFLIIMSVVIVIISVLSAFFIAKIIVLLINNLSTSAKQIAKGNINVQIDIDSKDEIGDLAKDILSIKNLFHNLFVEINTTSDQLKLGNVDAKIDVDKFDGDYKTATIAINQTYTDLINYIFDMQNCISDYAKGKLDTKSKRFPGKMSLFHENLDLLQVNISDISKDINLLIKNASNGNFQTLIDTSHYEGDWKNISDDLNNLVKTVQLPIFEVTTALEQVSLGKFDTYVTGDYKGQFDIMKQSVNKTITNVSMYINDISFNLTKLSNQDLDITIEKDYIGDFKVIKDALTAIVYKFNVLISEFNLSAEQVSSGARLISESSMSLAHGATQQASAVQELTSTISIISNQTVENANNAKKANTLANESKEDGVIGRSEMDKMLQSMNKINEASLDISKIIKTIEDIAFQTNLLALNAAVEAARAGVHGKGFAVVSEEVRNLAVKSQTATIETAELINKTIEIVAVGTSIANITASALNKMVDKVTNIASIINEVSTASTEQENAIMQINEGINQISAVTYANTATSQESASSAEELSSQAEVFKNAISNFNLKAL